MAGELAALLDLSAAERAMLIELLHKVARSRARARPKRRLAEVAVDPQRIDGSDRDAAPGGRRR